MTSRTQGKCPRVEKVQLFYDKAAEKQYKKYFVIHPILIERAMTLLTFSNTFVATTFADRKWESIIKAEGDVNIHQVRESMLILRIGTPIIYVLKTLFKANHLPLW